jgi:hypothetical protein
MTCWNLSCAKAGVATEMSTKAKLNFFITYLLECAYGVQAAGIPAQTARIPSLMGRDNKNRKPPLGGFCLVARDHFYQLS